MPWRQYTSNSPVNIAIIWAKTWFKNKFFLKICAFINYLSSYFWNKYFTDFQGVDEF